MSSCTWIDRRPGGGAAMAKKASGSRQNGESLTAYFHRLFEERPELVDAGSLQGVLKRWLGDHPGEKEVPPRVKAVAAVVKSALRDQRRYRDAGQTQRRGNAAAPRRRKRRRTTTHAQRERFWELIERSRPPRGNGTKHVENLTRML